MVAYKDKSLDRLLINNEAGSAVHKQLISKEEYSAIALAHPVALYRPNIFIRVGLFLATTVIVLMSFGLFMLFTESFSRSDGAMAVICAIYALLIYGALEWLIHSKRHYRSGVDDALLWLSFGFIIADVNFLTGISSLQQSILIFILTLYGTLRFANSVMSGIMFISFLAIVFYGIIPLGTPAKAIMPFVIMAISFLVYCLVKTNKNKYSLRHYRYCMLMIEILSLISLYGAVNYYAVRELSVQLFGIHLSEGESITGGWFFWLTTLVIPPLYIVRSLQTKDAVLLRAGMLLLAGSVLTIHNYYSVAPIEQIMTLGGLVLILAAYFITRLLTTPKYGITAKEPENESSEGDFHLESLVVTETFNAAPDANTANGFQFGGGSSGGGGASGEY
jgi:hypothetical protein